MDGQDAVKACRRQYSPGEQRMERLLHWSAVAVAGIAATILVRLALERDDPVLAGSIGVYGIGLCAMFFCSALSNHDLMDRVSPWAQCARCLDHGAILFLIAATYTPFTLVLLPDPWGRGLFAFVWAIALAGIAAILIRRAPLPGWLAVGIYLALGWSVLAVLKPLSAAAPPISLVLLIGGGALYTAGVAFHLWHRLPYHTVIWHAFVLVAAGCHYAAVLTGVVLPQPAL